MDSSKLKNFIIIVLVAANLFLLGIVTADSARRTASEREALSQAEEVLSARGIAVTAVQLDGGELDVCTVSRDWDAEKKHAEAVLGKVTVTDLGGNIMLYSGANGTAQFTGTGGFNILLNEGAYPTGSDAEVTARSFLKKLGIKAEAESVSDIEDGSGTVVLTCLSGKTRILNCKVIFTFTNKSLNLVVGNRPLDDVSANTSEDALSFPTVLMRLVGIISEGGYVCSELQGAELCYVQAASASGTGTLYPVWRLTTDTGEYCLNGLTGKQETVT